jgi:GNAT superfamily N-acetyltransferase
MLPDVKQIQQILYRDPIWSVYAIADLQPAFAPYCHWSVVNGAQGEAVILLFTALQPPILFATGDEQAIMAALAESPLPERVYVTLRPEQVSLVGQYYRWVEEAHPMTRMVLAKHIQVAMPTISTLVRLQPADANAITDLYRQGGPFTPDYFDPYQLDDGIFYGVKDAQDGLVAVGGTHIIAQQAAMGAIGNMYTHPAHRGKGYARAVLTAIIAELQARTITTIVLNVDERNATARSLYERFGFTPYCNYIEVEGVRNGVEG